MTSTTRSQFIDSCNCECTIIAECNAASVRESATSYFCTLLSETGGLRRTFLTATGYTKAAPVNTEKCTATKMFTHFSNPITSLSWTGADAREAIIEKEVVILAEALELRERCVAKCCSMALCNVVHFVDDGPNFSCTLLNKIGMPTLSVPGDANHIVLLRKSSSI